MPASPVLTKAGVTWLSLQWSKPSGTPSDEGISYILEMEEETSVSICILNGIFFSSWDVILKQATKCYNK